MEELPQELFSEISEHLDKEGGWRSSQISSFFRRVTRESSDLERFIELSSRGDIWALVRCRDAIDKLPKMPLARYVDKGIDLFEEAVLAASENHRYETVALLSRRAWGIELGTNFDDPRWEIRTDFIVLRHLKKRQLIRIGDMFSGGHAQKGVIGDFSDD